MTRTRRLAALAGLSVLVLLVAAAALGAFLPPPGADDEAAREAVVEIPRGTWARRMAGEKLEILPDTIRLTLGLRDVLVLKNRDDVPQLFGPALMMPGQSFRLPFEQAATYSFQCSAHASGQMRVIVAPAPRAGWERLQWRLRAAGISL